MKKEKIAYAIISIMFIIITIAILKSTDLTSNVTLSRSIAIILILYLIRIAYGCLLYIKRQYKKHKYSYGIIMNLGLFLFIIINLLRHIDLLIQNWNQLDITDIYVNTLESFSYFAMIILPGIIILSVYSIITNIILIKKEGFAYSKLLGVILGFIAIIGLFGVQTVYYILSRILTDSNLFLVGKLMEITINSSLSYLYCVIIATLYCNIMAARHIPKYDKDYVIILGCKINEDGSLTPLLKSRVDKAIDFAKKQKENSGKDIIFIPSGGKGSDEIVAEATAIKNYLIEQGISKKNIIIEDKSTSTIENIKYSNEIIIKNKKNANISFSTTNYHVFRTGVIANEQDVDCEGMGSKTKWYFYTNALIREFVATLISEKKKHIVLLLIIVVSSLTLLLIGYYSNFI